MGLEVFNAEEWEGQLHHMRQKHALQRLLYGVCDYVEFRKALAWTQWLGFMSIPTPSSSLPGPPLRMPHSGNSSKKIGIRARESPKKDKRRAHEDPPGPEPPQTQQTPPPRRPPSPQRPSNVPPLAFGGGFFHHYHHPEPEVPAAAAGVPDMSLPERVLVDVPAWAGTPRVRAHLSWSPERTSPSSRLPPEAAAEGEASPAAAAAAAGQLPESSLLYTLESMQGPPLEASPRSRRRDTPGASDVSPARRPLPPLPSTPGGSPMPSTMPPNMKSVQRLMGLESPPRSQTPATTTASSEPKQVPPVPPGTIQAPTAENLPRERDSDAKVEPEGGRRRETEFTPAAQGGAPGKGSSSPAKASKAQRKNSLSGVVPPRSTQGDGAGRTPSKISARRAAGVPVFKPRGREPRSPSK